MSKFDFKVETAEGAVFEPWTDGYGIGFKVTAPSMPARYVYLNPSSAIDTGELHDTNVFTYLGPDGDPDLDADEPLNFISIWDHEESAK